jgi:hypothetical protein
LQDLQDLQERQTRIDGEADSVLWHICRIGGGGGGEDLVIIP